MATKQTPQRTDFLAGILQTAVEGGIGYWATIREYQLSEQKEVGGNYLTGASCEVNADDGKGWRRVSMDTISVGLTKIVRGEVAIADRHRKTIAGADALNDASDIDSELADCILQVGLLGELVYG